MRVHEIMTAPVEKVPATMQLDEASALMRSRRVHHLVVTERSGIVGLLSTGDVQNGTPDRRIVRDVMSVDVATIDENDTVRRAANLMRGRSVGCLVVTSHGRLAGIVTVSDLLDLLGKGNDRRTSAARASLHYRVPHEKQHRGRSW
jgi:CBS domain-containing protein